MKKSLFKNYLSSIKKLFFKATRYFLFLYLVTILLSLPFTNYRTAFNRAQSDALSRFMPPFAYLIDFRDRKVSVDKIKFQEYLSYFQKANQFVPRQTDLLTLMAYCSYYLGQEKKSLALYQQALQIAPGIFAGNYNLGALYFKQKNYSQAVHYLFLAMQTDIIKNITMIPASRIYFPIIRDPSLAADELTAYYKLGFERCYRLLILSQEQLKNPALILKFSQQALLQGCQDPAFFYYYAGRASYELGKTAQAISFLGASLSLNPQNAPAQEQLAQALAANGQKEMSKQALIKAKELRSLGEQENPEEIVLQIY